MRARAYVGGDRRRLRLWRWERVDGVSESGAGSNRVDLYWIPVGAGGASPRLSDGHLYEVVVARHEGREPLDLVHAALVVRAAGVRVVIEMAPAWGPGRAGSGVVSTGPVGLRVLGRSRFFRYEVRRWTNGVIPDLEEAIAGPRCLADDEATPRRVLDLVPFFPTATWGRDELGTGDMWNSNSLIAWLLVRAGIDLTDIAPPAHSRAPGWSAGLVVAARRDPRRTKGRDDRPQP